ncbi:MAG: hypothetical protein U5L96_09070 [Owenweeksia sp.]|nr:hypothetical protein [Owenweeksia sp.]
MIRPRPRSGFTTILNASCAPFTIDSSLVNTQVLPYPNDQYYWEVINASDVIVAQDTGINALYHTIPTAGDSVRVRLTVTSSFGCQSDTSIQVFYTHPDPVANFTPLPATGCTPLSVTVSDSSNTPNKWWYVNDVLFHTGNNPSFQFTNQSATQDSTVIIKLVVSSGQGCSDSTTRLVTIHPQPQADFSIPAISCGSDTLYPANNSVHQIGTASFYWKALSNKVLVLNDSTANPAVVVPSNHSSFDSTYSLRLVLTIRQWLPG